MNREIREQCGKQASQPAFLTSRTTGTNPHMCCATSQRSTAVNTQTHHEVDPCIVHKHVERQA